MLLDGHDDAEVCLAAVLDAREDCTSSNDTLGHRSSPQNHVLVCHFTEDGGCCHFYNMEVGCGRTSCRPHTVERPSPAHITPNAGTRSMRLRL
jgi:hypothetical protein